MWFLYYLSWFSTMLHIFLAVMTIAAGLYYLADIVEEYTMMTSKVIKWSVMTTLGLYVGLFLFEGFPTTLVLCGLLSQTNHLLLLSSFPFFAVFSPSFIIAIVFVFVNHYLAFQFFGETHYSFTEVMAYFTLCLWFVPFIFFVSLSANENSLPTLSERRPLLSEENDVVSNYFLRKENKYGLRAGFAALKEILLPSRGKKSY
ncbi:protein TEX261 [Lepeophtheirus salmonis]|uniref:protein TEX261 n=1 Tax=Lepeophtheirus salmonis TaxID=72036 RepID=UPI001AE7BA34|nr:protein TEX261-like [Lepeophtheirus salmonis]